MKKRKMIIKTAAVFCALLLTGSGICAKAFADEEVPQEENNAE